MPPRMTIAHLLRTPVGQTNAAILQQTSCIPRSVRAAPVDCADTLLALAQALTQSDDPAVVQAAQVVAGLTRNHPFRSFWIDLADAGSLTAVEINGGRWQPGGGKHATARDRQKVRQLQQAGWIVLEFLTEECTADPVAVMQEIAQTIMARRGEST